MDVLMDWT